MKKIYKYKGGNKMEIELDYPAIPDRKAPMITRFKGTLKELRELLELQIWKDKLNLTGNK